MRKSSFLKLPPTSLRKSGQELQFCRVHKLNLQSEKGRKPLVKRKESESRRREKEVKEKMGMLFFNWSKVAL